MDGEKIYFDEEVKGHNLLITSYVIAHKGKRFDTTAVDSAATAVLKQSVNGIPSASSYKVSIGSKGDTIIVECARFGGVFRLGKNQYERLRAALGEAVGGRLISDAVRKLLAGGTLVFDHKGSLVEKASRFTLSRWGMKIEQTGIMSSKEIMIEWQHLRMRMYNGRCYFQCYVTGKKAAVQMWHMSNNIVFNGVLHFLMEKANYRALEA